MITAVILMVVLAAVVVTFFASGGYTAIGQYYEVEGLHKGLPVNTD